MAFTAFGERIVGTQNSTSTRFGYVGSYGYESTPNFGTDPDSDIGFLHVGARYYDPATGRFLQRDPIGIRGGTNAYGYTGGHPTVSIDPTGLRNDWGLGDIPPDMLKEIRRREREREREENRRRNTTPQSPEDMKKELRNERIKQLVTGGLIGAGGLVSVPVGIVALCIDIGASVYAINDPG